MAKKDAYYFSHDANARNDVKCLRLRREMGLEGYGIFWCLIEMLREEENHKLPVTLIEDIAFNLHTSKEKVEAVIKRYELFDFDDFSFFSSRLLRSMLEYKQLKNKLSEAGRKGGYGKAMAGLKQPSGIKGKERKENEIKGNESKEDARIQQIVEMFSRATSGYSKEILLLEAGKLINRYPDVEPNKSAALINTWASKIKIQFEASNPNNWL